MQRAAKLLRRHSGSCEQSVPRHEDDRHDAQAVVIRAMPAVWCCYRQALFTAFRRPACRTTRRSQAFRYRGRGSETRSRCWYCWPESDQGDRREAAFAFALQLAFLTREGLAFSPALHSQGIVKDRRQIEVTSDRVKRTLRLSIHNLPPSSWATAPCANTLRKGRTPQLLVFQPFREEKPFR
jgi:hypothetical protein